MTGRYIWRTHVNDGFGLGDKEPLLINPGRMTLASLTKSQGYRTAAIGKWHIGLGTEDPTDWNKPLNPGPLSVGFDYFFGMAANAMNAPYAYIEGDYLVDRIPGQLISIEAKGGEVKTLGISPLRKDVQVMGDLTKKAVQWLDENHEGPFFLYFAPNAVHWPFTPSARFAGSPLGKYGDFIHELDDSVAQVVSILEKHGVLDETLIVFTGDNGAEMAPNDPDEGYAMRHGLKLNGILHGGKHSIWEGGFREPFIVRWPGEVPANSESDDIVCLTDILATLAGILGVPLPAGNAEDSFDVSASWLGTETAGGARKGLVIHAAQAAEYAIRQGPWKLIEHENRPTPIFRSKGVEDSVKLWRKTPKKDELFNLVEDPSETKNVAAQHPEIVAELRQKLHEARDKPATRPGA